MKVCINAHFMWLVLSQHLAATACVLPAVTFAHRSHKHLTVNCLRRSLLPLPAAATQVCAISTGGAFAEEIVVPEMAAWAIPGVRGAVACSNQGLRLGLVQDRL